MLIGKLRSSDGASAFSNATVIPTFRRCVVHSIRLLLHMQSVA